MNTENFNELLNKLYTSVESRGYELIDEISNISEDIFLKEPLKTITSSECLNYIFLLLNITLFGIILYSTCKMLLSLYNGNEVMGFYRFIFKIVIILIISQSSYDICKEIVNINYNFTSLVSSMLEEIADKKINYKVLPADIKSVEEYFMLDDKINVEGLSKLIICIYVINLLIIFSIRYVYINISIMLSPFLILLSLLKETQGLCKMWIKLFVFCLSVQTINKVILFIPITAKEDKSIYSVVLIGTLLFISKLNCYVVEKIWKE